MSRTISATNLAEINASHLHEVVLVHLAFDTPLYVHSGIGTISYGGVSAGNSYKAYRGAVEPAGTSPSGNEYKASRGAVEPSEASSNDYIGVGALGSIGNARESELLGPSPLTLTLSGIDSTYISEGLDSGNYGDQVTIYVGYRQDDGTLVDDPVLIWRGFYDNAEIKIGQENGISINCQHDLAVLGRTDGSRFTDEDQQKRFSSDVGFEFVADMATQKLIWGGGAVANGTVTRSKNPVSDPNTNRFDDR